jgi:hypothetical protein
MPRRDLCIKSQLQLAEASNTSPMTQQYTEVVLGGRARCQVHCCFLFLLVRQEKLKKDAGRVTRNFYFTSFSIFISEFFPARVIIEESIMLTLILEVIHNFSFDSMNDQELLLDQ